MAPRDAFGVLVRFSGIISAYIALLSADRISTSPGGMAFVIAHIVVGGVFFFAADAVVWLAYCGSERK